MRLPTPRTRALSLALLFALGIAAPACRTTGQVDPDAEADPLERVPVGEAEAIAETLALLDHFMETEYGGPGRPALRDAHAKAHGCVKAEFVVGELDDSLRVGLFREPGRYPAWIRFSNGNDRPQGDAAPDGRGMAVKVMNVPGKKLLPDEIEATTQDFVMINHPVFFVDTAKHYASFTRAQLSGRTWSYFLRHLRGFWIALKLRGHDVANPLESQYWSMSAYRFGDGERAAKFSARPCSVSQGEFIETDSPHFLADNMERHLSERGGCFEFLIQRQGDPRRMPVEDPTVLWNESKAPFVPVATIRIPEQGFRDPGRTALCENLSMTPWHALPEHRPLGGINRLRRAVYERISTLRHEMNQTLRAEPSAGPDFLEEH